MPYYEPVWDEEAEEWTAGAPIPEESNHWEQFAATQQGGQYAQDQPLDYQGLPNAQPWVDEQQAQMEGQAAGPAQPMAFPGLPVIEQGGQFGYGGQAFNSEQEAMQARAQHAANPQAQQQFQAAEQARMALRAGQQPEAEPTSIQIRQEMSRHQLSRADRIELQQIENGIARIQRDAREGRVPPNQAQQLVGDLQQRAAGRYMTMQQLIAEQRMLDLTMARENHQFRVQQQTRASQFFQRNAPGAMIPHRDADGNLVAQSIVDLQGDLRTIPVPRQPPPPREPRQTLTPEAYDRVVSRAEAAADRVMSASGFAVPTTFAALPGEQEAETRERYRQHLADSNLSTHLRRMGVGGEEGGGTSGGPAARPIAENAELGTLPQDQQRALRQFQTYRERLDTPNNPRTSQERAQFENELTAAEALYRQYGSVRSMPPPAQQAFSQRIARIQALMNSRTSAGRPPAAASPPPAAAPATGRGRPGGGPFFGPESRR